MHSSTFEYLKPTEQQMQDMALLREDFALFVGIVDNALPAGPDKTYIIRKLRECAMWANVAITRDADGSPRS